MKCPVCPDERLVMADRAGVEIDYCPRCRGVWLDRGELDKILERTANATPAPTRPSKGYDSDYPQPFPPEYDRYGKPKKRKSMLSEIFDF